MDLDLDLDPYLQAWDEPGSKPGFLPPDQGGLYTTWLTVNTLSYSPASQLISTFLRFVLLVTLHDMSCEFSTVKFYNRPDSNQPTLLLFWLTLEWSVFLYILLLSLLIDIQTIKDDFASGCSHKLLIRSSIGQSLIRETMCKTLFQKNISRNWPTITLVGDWKQAIQQEYNFCF